MEFNLTRFLFFNRIEILKNLMRTIILLFCVVAFGFTPKNGFSQNDKILIEKSKEYNVNEVFELIISQTDYNFIYSKDLFDNSEKVMLVEGIVEADKLLNTCLENTSFTYEFVDSNTIILSKKITEEEVVLSPEQEEIIITGTVTDIYGTPLPDVAIVYGENNQSGYYKIGVPTDFDGKYTLKYTPTLSNAATQLRAVYMGFVTKVEQINGRTVIDFVLEEDEGTLEEIVVVATTGYQKISKERATGAYTSVVKAQLEKPASSIAERLVGVTSGVQSTANADGSIDFEIRGQSSLLANAQPLVVYDGFPIEGGMDAINPNDVESITVLKDAAAASIWGARSANGVIVVTSKKGKKGATNVTFSSFLRFSSKIDLDYSLNRASSNQEIDYIDLGFATNTFSTGRTFWMEDEYTFDEGNSNAFITYNLALNGYITDEERDAMLNKMRGLDNTRQIEDELLESPFIQNYNFSVSGGNEKMTNSLSILFENDRGNFKGNRVNKYIANFQNRTNLIKDRLDFEFSGSLQVNDQKRNGVSLNDLSQLSSYDMLKNEDGSLTDLSHLKHNLVALDALTNLSNYPYGGDISYNPITEINNRDRTTKSLMARVQAGLSLQIVKGLSWDSKIQFEMINSEDRNEYNENTHDVRRTIIGTSTQNFWFNGPDGEVTQNLPSGGVLELSDRSLSSYNWRNQVNYDRVFSEKHQVNFVGGTELREIKVKSTINPTIFGYDDLSLNSAVTPTDIESRESWIPFIPVGDLFVEYPFEYNTQHIFNEATEKYFSYFANASYTYNGKYTATGSFRTDASNVITSNPEIRYSPFWSAGLGWQAHKESFMAGVNWLDRLNVRATYGYNGNVDRSTSAIPLISRDPIASTVTGEYTTSISSHGNPLLGWEKTRSYNIGFDFSTMQSKLFGSLDVYNKKGGDLIVSESIPSVNGTTTQVFNNGEMINKGFELTLGTSLPIKNDDIVWSGTLNYSYNDNKITSFFKTDYLDFELTSDDRTLGYVEGYDANTIWSYTYSGLNDVGAGTTQPTIVGQGGENVALSSSVISGNAIEFMNPEGTTVAPTLINMRNSFKIYDFNLSFIVGAKLGHKFRRTTFNYEPLWFGVTPIQATVSEVLDPNLDPSKVVPMPNEEHPDSRLFRYATYTPYLDYVIADAGHIRFQEINLAYNLPSETVEKWGINSLVFYLQGNNIGTILFNEYGEDPEYLYRTVKPQSSFTIGFNLNF